MDVDHAASEGPDHRLGQDPAVGCDNAEIRLEGVKGFPEFSRLQALGLEEGYAGLDREALHGTERHVLPAPAGTVWLCDDTHHQVPRAYEPPQGRRGKRRRTKEDETERHHLPDFLSFWMRRTIMSRLIPRSRSTN